jgi:hypothetical protein
MPILKCQDNLKRHLADYKRACLGITEPGIFEYRGRDVPQDHILPVADFSRNLLEEASTFFSVYPNVKRHQFFHHLNSSQAFAFNLFFPYFSGGPEPASALLRALDCEGVFGGWEPKAVPDAHEGSNIVLRDHGSFGCVSTVLLMVLHVCPRQDEP